MSVDIHYYADEPAWKVVVADPARFRGVNYDLEIKLFRMPTGALVALWLRLYDVVDQPFFLHRVLDPTDETIGPYLQAVKKAGKIVVMFESPGEQEGFAVELPVNPEGVKEVLKGAQDHRERLGDVADGEKAVEDFLQVFNAALKEEKSVEVAWERVRSDFPYTPPTAPPEPPATSTWHGVARLFGGGALFIVAGLLLRSWTPMSANAGLVDKIVRPGYAVKVYLADGVRSIGGKWKGEAPSFTLDVGEQSFIDSIATHSDDWSDRISESNAKDGGSPRFRPYIEIRLKDDPDLSGRTLKGEAQVRAVYPVFSGVAFKEVSGTWRKKISITVFTLPQLFLARIAPLLLTVGFFLGVLTVLALYRRLAAKPTPDE